MNTLTDNSVKIILEKFEDKTTFNTNLLMQVVEPSELKEAKGSKVQSFKLSDGRYFAPTAIVTLKEGMTPLKNLQLIRIKTMKFSSQKQSAKKILFITSKEDAGQAQQILGNPVKAEENEILGHNSVEVNDFEDEFKEYTLIKNLSTFSKEFTLKVRVNKKSDMKHYKNSKGDGNLFSFVIIDEEGTEMQVTCFSKVANDFYAKVEEGSLYMLKGGSVKMNDKKYNAIDNDYKLILDEYTTLTPIEDPHSKIPFIIFDFVPIEKIEEIAIGKSVDVVGKVTEAGEKRTITTKSNNEMDMRKMKIADKSGYSIELTLWKAHASEEMEVGDFVAIKNVKVGEFKGKTLSTVQDTTIQVNPEIPEIIELKNFFSGNQVEFKQFKSSDAVGRSKPLVLIEEMKNEMESRSDDKFPYYRLNPILTTIPNRERNFYRGCPECRKKVQEDSYGYKCEPCNKTIQEPNTIYTLSLCFKDVSGQIWVDLFGDIGEILLGINAKEFSAMIENSEEEKINETFRKVTGRDYIIVVKPKLDTYNEQPKKRFSLVRLEKDYGKIELMKEKLDLIDYCLK